MLQKVCTVDQEASKLYSTTKEKNHLLASVIHTKRTLNAIFYVEWKTTIKAESDLPSIEI